MRLTWETLLGSDWAVRTPGIVEELARVTYRQDVLAGESVLSCHDPAEDLVLLAHGDVALGTLSPASHPGLPGVLMVERSVTAPAWVDVCSAWRSAPYGQDAQATSDAVVLRLRRDAALALMAVHPGLAGLLMRCMAEQVDLLHAVNRDLLHKDAEERFVSWLLQRTGPVAEGISQAVITLVERKRDIAAQLGVTPETLSRLQRSLTRKGLIEVMGYSVRLLDLPRLRRLAD